MREILFRGKREDNGEWVFGDLLRSGIDYITAIRTRCGENTYEVVSVDPKTVGEFTGLCDKNGKKIFEGDIIEYLSKTVCEGHTFVLSHSVYTVVFDCSSFGTQQYLPEKDKSDYIIPFDDYSDGVFAQDCEVIGNIYDDPNLIK